MIKPKVNSRAKGARGEREFAKLITKVTGTEARRGQQFSGGPESPDVVHRLGFHAEIKRIEGPPAPYKWMEQSIRDAGFNKIPTVQWRTNGNEWLTILRAEDFLTLFKTDV